MAFLKIELKEEWMTYPKGMVLQIKDVMAKKLVQRNTAKIIEDKNGAKEIESPVKDKMIKKPELKK